MSSKAQRAIVRIGGLEVEGYQLPDGSYAMSQTQAADAVGLKVQNASDFLRSKTLKALMGEGYTPQIVEIEAEEQARGGSRINSLPLEVVAVYWQWQSHRGNKQAFKLCAAFTLEGLIRRFDAAFGRTRSEAEYEAELSAMQVLLGSQDKELEMALAVNDDKARENRELWAYLQEQGLPGPYQLPEEGERND
ncbi:MAG: hypothetical protein HC771_22660 [Synechococcales cyanobacterium CRU_2_2]|nr:hypothetical protein [Synechococcales cyanobacterium CRU_2_2]